MQKEKSNSSELDELKEEFRLLNQRLSHVEESLSHIKGQKNNPAKIDIEEPETEFELKLPFQSNGSIEFRVGEYGMAWLGNIVLFFAITFLVGYLQNTEIRLFSVLVGFISVAGIYASSYFTRTSYSYLSKLFEYNGHFLLFYLTVRLHFFQDNPLIKNETFGLLVLIVVVAILLYKAFRDKSQLMAGIVLLMMLISGVISNSTTGLAGIATATALITVLFYSKFGWIKLAFTSIFLIYLVHLCWLLNNPFMGNIMEFIPSPGVGYLFFIATGFIFSMLALIPKKEQVTNDFIITSIVWNGLGFTFLLALIIITYFQNNYVPIFTSITLFCLIYSFVLQLRSALKITASMYALYGFLALSVAIYGIFGLPKSYLLFSAQSLLVVSMALWFRSRFIVVMNSILFSALMIFYVIEPESYNDINFSFMLVAFISARVIYWKKERLNIKTEFVRDLYLGSGFFMTLITFYHVSPASYITASWISAAVLLFILSLLIGNIKYRWLAITTMVVSAIRLIFVDMSSIDIGYRVLVFLSLSIISIVISILYTRYFVKKK
jgi:hypothetical protein